MRQIERDSSNNFNKYSLKQDKVSKHVEAIVLNLIFRLG